MAKVDMEVDAKYSDDQKHNCATSYQRLVTVTYILYLSSK